MENKQSLFHLFENYHCDSLNIVYYDGQERHSISFSELWDFVTFIYQLFKDLLLSEQIICCLIKPSLILPAIILGILKVSSTFAFLDVHKPYERLQDFQKYLEVKTLLIEDNYVKDLKPKLCSCWKKLSEFQKLLKFTILQSKDCKNKYCPNINHFIKSIPQSEIAYCIQTSGTTGEAKVVQVPHECIASNLIDLRSRFSVTSNDVILQSTRLTFDPSIIEIFLALLSGASLVFVADHIRSIPEKLVGVIMREKITILQSTPSLIYNFGEKVIKNVLLGKESSLRILAFGGEMCPSMHKLRKWKSEDNKTEIFNLYGITELSCWASCFKIDFDSRNLISSLPIGEPLLNTQFKILNEDRETADEGELYVGGGNKRFCIINNEKLPDDLEYFLRPTGDLVTKSSDGFIYFEGRSDSVIKYMGHKVSLKLVNDTVEKFPDVANHLLYYHSPSLRLYLFIIWTLKPSCETELKQKLLENLKDDISTLPAVVIVPVPFIPLTKHGKADIRKLISFANEIQQKRNYPESVSDKDIDNFISSSWKSFTNQSIILDNDSFIEKGGDSIAAVQFAVEIEWLLQLQLPLLVEKILNKSYLEVKDYIKSHSLKEDLALLKIPENHSLVSVNHPVKKRKYCDISHCFKVYSKQGYKEYCKHTSGSENCFNRSSNSSENLEFHPNLVFTWDLKKCIDATPCIVYLPGNPLELLVFIGSHYGMFSCIDVIKRFEKWQILVQDRIESSACVSACGSYVLFGSYDHYLYCININTGTIHWKFETGAEIKSSPSVSFCNSVFVGSHDKHVYATDVKSGCLLWKNQVAYGSIFSSPAVIEDIGAICIGTLDGVFALLKMVSGDVLWKYNVGKPFFSSPLVTSNYILIGNTDKFLLCLDFDGNKKFAYATEGPIFSSPANNKDCEDRIVFGCHDSFVYCINLEGNLVWKTLCDSVVYATPCIFKLNCIYYVCAASSQGIIYFFELTNGKIIFSWKCPGEVFSSPGILNDTLVIGCRDNNIYCFDLKKCIKNIQ